MNANDLLSSFDVSSRASRRRAVLFVIDLLELVRAAEELNISSFPLNLQNGEAFDNAECSLEIVSDSLICLGDAY